MAQFAGSSNASAGGGGPTAPSAPAASSALGPGSDNLAAPAAPSAPAASQAEIHALLGKFDGMINQMMDYPAKDVINSLTMLAERAQFAPEIVSFLETKIHRVISQRLGHSPRGGFCRFRALSRSSSPPFSPHARLRAPSGCRLVLVDAFACLCGQRFDALRGCIVASCVIPEIACCVLVCMSFWVSATNAGQYWLHVLPFQAIGG